jgi:hypothetical protein
MTRDERIAAIRKRLERSNPFSPDRADLEWALGEMERDARAKRNLCGNPDCPIKGCYYCD